MKLLMHYAPGLLVILKTQHCEDTHHYGDTGCNRDTHTYTTVVNVGLLAKGEEAWCLEQSRIPKTT